MKGIVSSGLCLVVLSAWMGGLAAAGEADGGRQLTIRVDAVGETTAMVQAMVQSKLLKGATGYRLVADQDTAAMTANFAAIGEVSKEQARAQAEAAKNKGVDVVVNVSAKVIAKAVRVSVEAKDVATGAQIALARHEVRGPVDKPGMSNRMIEKAIELAMPSVLKGLQKHRTAGDEQGKVSPVDLKAAQPSKAE